MAFYDAPNPTNDPNYLHQSREPSRIPTVQDVAVPAKISSDASLGKLFQGVGDVLGLGLAATDQVIKDNIKKDAYAAIDPIRDEHGADMAPGEVQPIAGTGQRGRNRIAALGAGGQTGVVSDAVTGPVLPGPVNLEVGRIQRLRDAYMAGKLSDSYYDAELVAKVKELKAKYPGYRDEVEAAVAGITGINPANALRKSLLSDMNAQQAASMAKTQSFDNFTEKHGDVVSLLYPDYFQNKAKYAGQEDKIRGDVHAFESRSTYIKSQEAEIGFDAKLAEGVAIQRASLIAGQGITSMSNVAGLSDPQTLQKTLADLAKRGGGTPEEIAQFNTNLAAIRANAEINVDKMLNSPIEGRKDGATYASIIKDPAKIKAIRDGALAQYDALATAMKTKDFQLAATIATRVTMEKNQAAKAIMDKVPLMKVVGGIQSVGGDQVVGQVFQSTQLLPQLQKAIVDAKLTEVLGAHDGTTSPPGIDKQIDEIGRAAPVNGKAVDALVKGNLDMINNRVLPAGVAPAAVKNLFRPEFFARLPEGERMKVFTMLSSPENTKRIAEIAQSDPSVWQQYKDFSVRAAASVYNTAAGTLQSYITDKRFDIRYNENTHQFEGSIKPEYRGRDDLGVNNVLQRALNPINQTLLTLAPIVGKDGDVNTELHRFIQSVNINPDAPKSGGTISKLFEAGWSKAKELGGAVRDAMPEIRIEDTKSRKRSDISTEGAAEPALRDTIGKAESGGDYNNVFGMGKRNQMNLADMTVGEVMAMQKHHTDSGSPSSAAGKYQFLRKTLQSLVREGLVSQDDQFTPDLQDNLAVALMKRRGLDQYRSGKMTKEAFANNLAKEWAGLPTTSGMSFYAGDGLNASTVQLPKVLAALE